MDLLRRWSVMFRRRDAWLETVELRDIKRLQSIRRRRLNHGWREAASLQLRRAGRLSTVHRLCSRHCGCSILDCPCTPWRLLGWVSSLYTAYGLAGSGCSNTAQVDGG